MNAEKQQDDYGVLRFAEVMSLRMEEKRSEGKHGWWRADLELNETLKRGLSWAENAGRWVDVANYAMMLHWRQENGLK